MTPRKAALALALVVVGVTAAPLTAPRAFAAPAGDEAVSKDPVGDATKIRDEAKLLFRLAGDPDADAAERSKSRKECFKKLKHARKLLDDHLAAHPDEAEALDALYCDLSSMLFWVKKELTLDEIKELQGGAPSAPPLPQSAGGAAPGSVIGGAQPRDPAGPPAGVPARASPTAMSTCKTRKNSPPTTLNTATRTSCSPPSTRTRSRPNT